MTESNSRPAGIGRAAGPGCQTDASGPALRWPAPAGKSGPPACGGCVGGAVACPAGADREVGDGFDACSVDTAEACRTSTAGFDADGVPGGPATAACVTAAGSAAGSMAGSATGPAAGNVRAGAPPGASAAGLVTATALQFSVNPPRCGRCPTGELQARRIGVYDRGLRGQECPAEPWGCLFLPEATRLCSGRPPAGCRRVRSGTGGDRRGTVRRSSADARRDRS
jgi:hypothetical protein